MQYSMFSAADIKVDRHPGFFDYWINWRTSVLWIQKPQVVPTRACPLRHGIRLALIALAINSLIEPFRRRFIERRFRPAVRLEILQMRQVHRQIFFIDRADPAGRLSV